MPYVIEPAAGLTRSLMAFLVDAYDVDEAPNTKGGVDKRTVLRLDPRLAPVKTAVLPLSKKPELQTVAHDLAADLRQHEWMIDYDEAGAIGRRYRREDEIGTPLCITVDFDTLDDQAVTIRERDTMQQERVALDKVADYVAARMARSACATPQVSSPAPWPLTAAPTSPRRPAWTSPPRSRSPRPVACTVISWPILVEHQQFLCQIQDIWHEPCRFVGESRDRHREQTIAVDAHETDVPTRRTGREGTGHEARSISGRSTCRRRWCSRRWRASRTGRSA